MDGGTEGFKGHVRVILPGHTACFECTLWLFPPQTKYPLCTLAETPRNAPHCIEYAKLILWGQARQGEEFNADVEEHMRWVYERAAERAKQFGIPARAVLARPPRLRLPARSLHLSSLSPLPPCRAFHLLSCRNPPP